MEEKKGRQIDPRPLLARWLRNMPLRSDERDMLLIALIAESKRNHGLAEMAEALLKEAEAKLQKSIDLS